jgi:hypothetical protein
MPRPNPQGIPLLPEARNATAAILRPLRACCPNRHEPPDTEQAPYELYNSYKSQFPSDFLSATKSLECLQNHLHRVDEGV